MYTLHIKSVNFISVLCSLVELLEHIHNCFTLASNMEGITAVLRLCRKLTGKLAQAEKFALIVQLLTRVARFSEMTYIFDILMQSHQFELLFRKGSDKV